MKTTKDVGYEYIKKLGMKPAMTLSDVRNQIKKVSNKKIANQIIDAMDARADGELEGSFYKLKNSSLDVSLALSGAFDANYIQKVCTWIAEHKPLFGDNILEVGCDCGILSCFLAKQFPDSHIVSIDRCEEAIENAKKLAEKLKINNIEFVVSDVADLEEQSFDTIFSSRTMHENCDDRKSPSRIILFYHQAEKYADELHDYASNFDRLSNDGTIVVSIERAHRDPLFVGWVFALNNNKFNHITDDKIICREVSEKSEFNVIVAQKGKPMPNAEMQAVAAYLFKDSDFSNAQLYDWTACVFLQHNLKELVEGYYVYGGDDEILGKLAIWTNKFDDDSSLTERYMSGSLPYNVMNCYKSVEKNNLDTIRSDVDNLVKNGFKVKQFFYDGEREYFKR